MGSVLVGRVALSWEKALKLWHTSLAVNTELSIMLKIDNHENIVQIGGLIRSNRSGLFRGYFLELMECSLNTIIHNIDSDGEETLSTPPRDYNCKVVAKWVNQINAGISFLHLNNIIHRDIKPAKVGTRSYKAPEIISGEYDHRVDIYAFSITLWEILHKKPIFEESEDDENTNSDASNEAHLVAGTPFKKKPRTLLTYDPTLEVVTATVDPDFDTYPENTLGNLEVLQTLDSNEQGYYLHCKIVEHNGQGDYLRCNNFGPVLVKYLGEWNDIIRQFRDHSGVGVSAAVATQIRLAADKRNLEREITFARELAHENIVRILGFISPDGRPDSINAIIMEGDFYGNLEAYASRNQIPLPEVKAFALQLASALQYCHSRGIMHRDVHARNIYVQQDKMAIKLGNFGYARVGDQGNNYTANKGEELYYRAPEMISDHAITEYTVSVDVYGFALVLWSMLHGGRKPYKDDPELNSRLMRNENKFKQYLVAGNRPRIDDNVDQGLANLIKKCWINETEIDKRPSMSSVVQTL